MRELCRFFEDNAFENYVAILTEGVSKMIGGLIDVYSDDVDLDVNFERMHSMRELERSLSKIAQLPAPP